MENTAESISIAISWYSLFKLATMSLISFAAINILRPLLFIFRDWVVWEYINKKLLNKELSTSIRQAVSSRLQLEYKYIHEIVADYSDPNEPLFSIGETAVEKVEFDNYRSAKELIHKRYIANANIITRRKMQLKRIDKYFDQNTYPLVDKEIEAVELSYKDRYTLESIYRPRGIV